MQRLGRPEWRVGSLPRRSEETRARWHAAAVDVAIKLGTGARYRSVERGVRSPTRGGQGRDSLKPETRNSSLVSPKFQVAIAGAAGSRH